MRDSGLVPEKAERFAAGDTVFGSFEIIDMLGSGGVGVVYKATNKLLNKVVALKVLPKARLNQTDLVRFQNEAKTLSRMKHPRIATVYDFSLYNGVPYLSMEYIEGVSLERHLEESKTLTLEELLDIAQQVCDGLEHAHARDVVHRDIKPANIILKRDEAGKPEAYVVDFGIAKFVQFDTHLGMRTQSGAFIGSPFYASPEQIKGETVSPAADLYSLGCLMFRALAGKPPFSGETVLEILAKASR